MQNFAFRTMMSWLNLNPQSRRIRRTIASPYILRYAEVEQLESRRMLSAAPVAAVLGSTNFVQAPVLDGFGGTLTYVQQGGAQLKIASTLTVTDGVSSTLASATVSFTNWQVGDRLGFFNPAALHYSFSDNLVSHTSTLSFTGTRTLADYQQELRTLAFFNVAGAPVTTTRVASIQVNDGYSSSNVVSENISFQQSPIVTGFSGSMTYVKGGPPLAFAATVVITDSQSASLSSATITFTNWNVGDRLSFSNSASLQHQFTEDFETHVATLKLSGTASLAAYQAVLRSLTFANVADAPVTTPRTVTLQVSDGSSASNAVSETITFGHAPVLTGLGGTLTYTEGGPQLKFATGIVVADPSSTTLSQATVAFTHWQTGDRLGFTNDVLQYSFSEDLTVHTAKLTLSGIASLAVYQAELRSLSFFNVAGAPDTTTRTVSVAVNSNGASSNVIAENIAFQLTAPTVSIAPASTTEGDSGSKVLSFVVTLSHPWATAVTVAYATSNQSATAGSDYVAASGTLTIPAGQTSGTINVSILGDTNVEPDGTFLVSLSSPHNATLGTASAAGTILNDDGSSGNVLSDNTTDSSSGTRLADATHFVAASFQTGSGFANLKSLSLLLACTSGTGSATVEVYSGTASQPVASVGKLVSPNAYSATATETVFTTNGFILLPNTVYWVVLKVTSGSFQWSFTNSTASSGSGYTGNWVSSTDAGSTWTASSSSPPQMKVVIN